MGIATAAPLNVADVPLFLPGTVPPLNMLVMSRDHRMYYEAYNDASDLNGDDVLDTGYKPAEIDYYGYFDTDRCYTYGSNVFTPTSATADKRCAGASEWSGDWLNYMTMSRIDAMRKVLYGGLRSTDTATETVLQRAFIPQDAHSWGKEYTNIATDGYDIEDYTPLAQPSGTGTRRHFFANTTPAGAARAGTRESRHQWRWVADVSRRRERAECARLELGQQRAPRDRHVDRHVRWRRARRQRRTRAGLRDGHVRSWQRRIAGRMARTQSPLACCRITARTTRCCSGS